MSTELKGTEALNGPVMLTRYWGGQENGQCVQVTPKWGETYLSLTKCQARDLAQALTEFADGVREEAE